MEKSAQSAHAHRESLKVTSLAAGVALLLIFAPLFRAGNRPLPLLILEMAAVVLLIIKLWPTESSAAGKIPGAMWAFGGILLLYPLLFLIPLPFEFWADLPGRAPYAAPLTLIEHSAAERPATIVPASTQASWLASLPPLALFFGAVALPTRYLIRLALVALIMAVGQALLGLMQFVAGDPDSALCLGNGYCGPSGATGTYVNRDHLAGFLEMMFPIGLGLLAVTVGRLRHKTRHYRQNWRERVLSLSSWQANAAFLYGAASIVILLGLVFSRSRTGVGLAMLCLLLALIAFARRLGGDNAFGPVGTVSAIAVALAVGIGLAPVFDRFTVNPLDDGRWVLFEIALQGIGKFFPLGSGPGTFPKMVLPLQPVEMGGFFLNHVHNDYLEWIFEGGLLSVAIILLLAAAYIRQWFVLGRSSADHWSSFRFIQVGAGIGLFLIALHGTVDFNWHIPANAVYTAFLAALFFHRPAPVQTQEKRGKRERSAPKQPPPKQIKDLVPEEAPQSVPEPVNPFLE
jgi:O-antigen ligase